MVLYSVHLCLQWPVEWVLVLFLDLDDLFKSHWFKEEFQFLLGMGVLQDSWLWNPKWFSLEVFLFLAPQHSPAFSHWKKKMELFNYMVLFLDYRLFGFCFERTFCSVLFSFTTQMLSHSMAPFSSVQLSLVQFRSVILSFLVCCGVSFISELC